MVLKENSLNKEEGWVNFHKKDSGIKLCGIPYHKNFRLVSKIFCCKDVQVA